MDAIAAQITSLTIVYSIVYSDVDQRKHQSSASLTFVWGIHRGPVNPPHKWPVTRKVFPFDDVIMIGGPYMDQTVREQVWVWDTMMFRFIANGTVTLNVYNGQRKMILQLT